MELDQFISMVNKFDEITRANLKRMLYGNEERSEACNIMGNNRSFGGAPPMTRNSNPLCDKIHNTKVTNLQVKPIFDTYNGEEDLMDHIKAFEMKFKLKFGTNDNLMAKYFPTTFRGDALNLYFSFLAKSINCYA